jgi:hypothetical protein
MLDEQPILNQFHPCHLTSKHLLYHSFHHFYFLTMADIYYSLWNKAQMYLSQEHNLHLA